MSLIASIGIGTAVYNMIKPNNQMRQAIKKSMDKMKQQKEVLPNQ